MGQATQWGLAELGLADGPSNSNFLLLSPVVSRAVLAGEGVRGPRPHVPLPCWAATETSGFMDHSV